LFDQRVMHVRLEVIGAGNRALRDRDSLLRVQLVYESLHVLRRRHAVVAAVDDEAGRWAGCQEREVVEVWLRRNRHETFDFWAAHQELHADPRAERIAGNPAVLRIRMERLDPVERCGGIRKLASPMVERALAAADATEIEA